jgi:hypothetical protein
MIHHAGILFQRELKPDAPRWQSFYGRSRRDIQQAFSRAPGMSSLRFGANPIKYPACRET